MNRFGSIKQRVRNQERLQKQDEELHKKNMKKELEGFLNSMVGGVKVINYKIVKEVLQLREKD